MRHTELGMYNTHHETMRHNHGQRSASELLLKNWQTVKPRMKQAKMMKHTYVTQECVLNPGMHGLNKKIVINGHECKLFQVTQTIQ